nr:immunoglobulin light chain junction region [Macaca mulatta]MOW39499.1 immunoglobulin light chain junction region [Macaca mulatta]MOW40233.1 immunoglobulin light chain junction region [Macaca mulatta]MOW40575.1 immunoglobulin light chain junction region [Macaca mulatta]
CQQHKSFPYSF